MLWKHLRIFLHDLMKWATNNTDNSTNLNYLNALDNETFADEEDNLTILHDPSISIPAVQALFCYIYLTIFVLGVTGNVLVCFIVFRNKNMQTVTNFFIANLAMSDILLCIFAVPLTPIYTFLGRWVFGSILCNILPFAQGVSIYISTLTLTSIAVDRYIVIIYPFKPRMKVSTCIIIIFWIWIVACIFTSPYCLYMKMYLFGGNYYCEEVWPEETVRYVFTFSTTILQFVLPFTIMAFCYLKVSISLRERARSKPGAKSGRQEDADRERKKRTNRMLIAMVAIFGASWLPVNLFNLVGDLHEPASRWGYRNLTFLCTHVMAMSSTCYNPFLYAWLNENFRKEFKMVLPFKRIRRTTNQNTTNPTGQCNGNFTAQEMIPLKTTSRVANDEEKANVSPSHPIEDIEKE